MCTLKTCVWYFLGDHSFLYWSHLPRQNIIIRTSLPTHGSSPPNHSFIHSLLHLLRKCTESPKYQKFFLSPESLNLNYDILRLFTTYYLLWTEGYRTTSPKITDHKSSLSFSKICSLKSQIIVLCRVFTSPSLHCVSYWRDFFLKDTSYFFFRILVDHL